jgi:hypothetical protein
MHTRNYITSLLRKRDMSLEELARSCMLHNTPPESKTYPMNMLQCGPLGVRFQPCIASIVGILGHACYRAHGCLLPANIGEPVVPVHAFD